LNTEAAWISVLAIENSCLGRKMAWLVMTPFLIRVGFLTSIVEALDIHYDLSLLSLPRPPLPVHATRHGWIPISSCDVHGTALRSGDLAAIAETWSGTLSGGLRSKSQLVVLNCGSVCIGAAWRSL